MRNFRRSLQPIHTSASFLDVCLSIVARITNSRRGLLVSIDERGWHYAVDNICLDKSGKMGMLLNALHNLTSESHFYSMLRLLLITKTKFYIHTIIG
jgi:hypothetical protein